jgi:hypothetical protein
MHDSTYMKYLTHSISIETKIGWWFLRTMIMDSE